MFLIYTQFEPHFAFYQGKFFPIYAKMDEMLNRALATGANTFQASYSHNNNLETSTEGDNKADINNKTSITTSKVNTNLV